LQVDFLERVIKPGQVFSVPNVTLAFALPLLDTCALSAADGLLHCSADGMCFMQLVEGKLRKRRMPCTAAARHRLTMWCPVTVQLYNAETTEVVARDAGEHATTYCLRPHG
ncbi:MAG: hypothetical protein ACKPKO_16395, partial [Candidatus Fonsibacter sp.]